MKISIYLLSLILLSIFTWFFFGLFFPQELLNFLSLKESQLQSLSLLGGAFGGANALFSSIALFLLMISVFLQQKELEATREELKIAAQAQTQIADMEKRALALQIIMPFMDDISSAEMRDSIIFLSDFKRQNDHFSEEFSGLLEKRKSNNLEADDATKLDRIDNSRRRFVMIFHRMYKLKNTHVVDDDIIKVVIGPDHVKLLLDVVQPLEQAIRENYSREIFEFAKVLYSEEVLFTQGSH